MRRLLRRAPLGLLGLASLAALSGATYEALARRRARAAFPVPGALVDVGGRALQIDCRGRGSPTVVFEAGLDLSGALCWTKVHEVIAATTRACAYSRAGIMWSDPSSEARTGAALARDLRALLRAAGEEPPFVLVGHSLGGPLITTFTRHFGDEVAGLVFVDPSSPDQVQRLAAMGGGRVGRPTRVQRVGAALAWAGVPRLLLPRETLPARLPAAEGAAVRAFEPTSARAVLAETIAFEDLLAEAGALRSLGDRPTIVLTAGQPVSEERAARLGWPRETRDRFRAARAALHAEQAAWSTRGEHRVIEDAGHVIQLDRPDAVIEAVRDVVAQVRAARR